MQWHGSTALVATIPARIRRGRPSLRKMASCFSPASDASNVNAYLDARVNTVVTPAWLASNANRDDVKVLDCSWYLPDTGRDGVAEHVSGPRVANARYFDVDAISDRSSPLPHMMPSSTQFAAACDALGIKNSDVVVCYDGAGLFSAARGWFMFRAFGHENVAVLDGGAPAYEKGGYPMDVDVIEDMAFVSAATTASDAVANAGTAVTSTEYKPSQTPVAAGFVFTKDDVLARCIRRSDSFSSEPAEFTLVDARPRARWAGEMPEPRPGVRKGRVPSSKCVPFVSLLNDDGTFKSKKSIIEMFGASGVDILNEPVVFSCGTGVTACVLALGAAFAGRSRDMMTPLYDGSWSEWGSDGSGCPVDASLPLDC